MEANKRRKRIVALIVIGYMLIALTWWTMLLNKKSNAEYELKKELLEFKSSQGLPDFVKSMEELETELARQKKMIMGEGLAFGIMLIIGIVLIFRAFRKELHLAEKENNFLLSITHELKSPIASIQLILETFKKRQLEKSLKEELTDNAIDETKRLNALVGNLLYANKLNHGQSFIKETVDLTQLVESVTNQFRKNHNKFHFNLDVQENVIAHLDRDAITIALNNLIENAVKYSGDSRTIGISLKSKKKIDLEISDSGIGVAKAEKVNIFNKFYRVGNEDTRTTKGTGLGLYITQQIMWGLGGKISIIDNKPKGSIFKITIPKNV